MTPLETLTVLRREYPTPMSKDQLGSLMNAVAWVHRDDGYGVLSKPAGNNCRQPQTGKLISTDLLVLPDGQIFDALIDSGGRAIPTWGTGKRDVSPSLWLPPVDAAIELPPSQPEPPSKPPIVPYIGDAAGVAIGRALFADYAAAGQAPNEGMGVWFLRISHDVVNGDESGKRLTPEESIVKHQREWRDILGLP